MFWCYAIAVFVLAGVYALFAFLQLMSDVVVPCGCHEYVVHERSHFLRTCC